MKIIKPHVYLLKEELSESKLFSVERAARLCYKSEEKMQESASLSFLNSIIKRGHESVLEHEKITVSFVVDRGITHEIVRHRIASYSQESTRYCNYSSNKFGNEITVIEPFFYINESQNYELWKESCLKAEENYIKLLETSSPQQARSILPNSLKTEIATTYNFREWRHFFKLRCAKEAHPQMQQVTIPLLLEFQKALPIIFGDISYNESFNKEFYAEIQLL